jgi:hypothetical protein
MNFVEDMYLELIKQKSLSQSQLLLAKKLSRSKEPFERFIGKLGSQPTRNRLALLKNECASAFKTSENYAHDILFILSETITPSAILQNSEIKQFIFKAARSANVSARINATRLLAKIVKQEKSAYNLLRDLKRDDDAIVRYNAQKFLAEFSQEKTKEVPA